MENRKKVNKLLVKLKLNAYKLKESGSLPLFFYKDLCKLGSDISEGDLRVYMHFSESYLRVKGFYKSSAHKDECLALEESYIQIKKERGLA